MKKLFLLMVIALFVAANVGPAFAGGDKVRGDKGQGPTEQNGPTPFKG